MQNKKSSKTGCIACGSPVDFFGRRGKYTYASCQSCGSIQLAPFPTKEELDRAYTEDYPTSGHQGIADPIAILKNSQPFYAAVLRELQMQISPPATVLDLGCGWGGMCRYLGNAGYDYLGIDYPAASLEYCRKEGLNVRAGTLEDMALEERRFSAVAMITVFEHLQDHAGTLQIMRQVLEPGGLLLVLIPTSGLFGRLAKMIRWIKGTEEIPAVNTTFCPPWHTVIFSVAGMHQLLTANGFEKVRIRPSPSGSGPGLLGMVQKAATMVAQTGFSLFGTRWPFVLNYIFVYRAR